MVAAAAALEPPPGEPMDEVGNVQEDQSVESLVAAATAFGPPGEPMGAVVCAEEVQVQK